jgi:hypothetical protein
MEKVKTIFYLCGDMEARDTNGSRDEKIGFHKGSLDSLLKERSELARLLSIVEQLISMHAKALQDMGINLTQKNDSHGTGKPGSLETPDQL